MRRGISWIVEFDLADQKIDDKDMYNTSVSSVNAHRGSTERTSV